MCCRVVGVLCKVPHNLYVTTVQYVSKYCVVCSSCVLLVEYVCKYCVNMCVNTVGMCVALHATIKIIVIS